MPPKKKGGKKAGKKGGKAQSSKTNVQNAGSQHTAQLPVHATRPRSPLLRPGEKLVDLLKKNPVEDRELHGHKIPPRILRQLSPQEIRDLNVVFELFDNDSDGLLFPSELRRAMRALGFKISRDEAKVLVSDSTLKQEGVVTFLEFLDIIISRQGDTRDVYEEIIKGFQLFDYDKTGKISVADLRDACQDAGIKFTRQDLEDMIEEADINGDGEVDQSEFIRIMLQTNLF